MAYLNFPPSPLFISQWEKGLGDEGFNDRGFASQYIDMARFSMISSMSSFASPSSGNRSMKVMQAM